MGYQENKYIIDPEVNDEKYAVEKPMESVSISNNKFNRDYEVIDVPDPSQNVLDDIHKAAVEEGLVNEEEGYIGGEGAKPEEVIDALIHKERSKGAQKNEEEYIDNKISKNRKIMATRDILTGMTKKNMNVTLEVVLDVRQPDGTIKPEVCDMDFVIRRLTESQFNHLVNRRLASKKLSEMTEEEYQEDNHFRSNYLAETVIDPKLTPDQWYNDVPNTVSAALFAKVQELLNNLNDTTLFQ